MEKSNQPSNLELQALSVLWHEGPSTVSAVHESLPDGKDRAYTTVLTIMQNLERKNLVKRSRVGRAHVYEAAYSQEVIVQHATNDFLTNAFGGRLAEALLAILSAGKLTPEEKQKIERELQRHKTMAAKKPAKKKAAKPAAPKKKVVKKAAKKAPAKKAAKKVAKKAVKKAATISIQKTAGKVLAASSRISSFDQKPAKGKIPARASAPTR